MQYTTPNCPNRRTYKIYLEKHTTCLHGYNYKKKSDAGAKKDEKQEKIHPGIQFKTDTREVNSMCVMPFKVPQEKFDKEVMTF